MSQIPDRRQVFMSRSPESVPEDPVTFWLSTKLRYVGGAISLLATRRIIYSMSGPESLSWANIDQEWALIIINVPVGVAYNVTVICYDHP